MLKLILLAAAIVGFTGCGDDEGAPATAQLTLNISGLEDLGSD